MATGTEEIFVIDKCGSPSETKKSTILYEFKSSDDSKELSPQTNINRRPVYGKRYHEVEDLSKFRPGHISHKLRRALNLNEYDIPIHIYRMRTLGYPPGWLRKAIVGGDLAIFNDASAKIESNISYNREALIGFPGFNVESKRFQDAHLILNCPPIQSRHMLENFYAALSVSCPHNSSNNQTLNETDKQDLHQLQAERERLLAEIRQLDHKLNSSSKVDGTVTASDPNQSPIDANVPPENSNDSGGVSSEIISNETAKTSNEDHPQVSGEESSTNTFEEGTPISIRPIGIGAEGNESVFSPLSTKRPPLEAFSVGIQPLKLFENLPRTRGGYQRVLNTLRNSREYFSDQKSIVSNNSYSDSSNYESRSSFSPLYQHHQSRDSHNHKA